MSGRPAVKSAFENLRPTIMREPVRSAVSPEAEARLLATAVPEIFLATEPMLEPEEALSSQSDGHNPPKETLVPWHGSLLVKKKRERLLLVSFRMPQSLKEKLELAAKKHEINQTDLINEAIELNLRRYV